MPGSTKGRRSCNIAEKQRDRFRAHRAQAQSCAPGKESSCDPSEKQGAWPAWVHWAQRAMRIRNLRSSTASLRSPARKADEPKVQSAALRPCPAVVWSGRHFGSDARPLAIPWKKVGSRSASGSCSASYFALPAQPRTPTPRLFRGCHSNAKVAWRGNPGDPRLSRRCGFACPPDVLCLLCPP